MSPRRRGRFRPLWGRPQLPGLTRPWVGQSDRSPPIRLPLKTSSCSLVSSRQTAICRSPRVSRRSESEEVRRWGVSNATRVRRSTRRLESRSIRSVLRLGRKPRNTKPSVGKPDAASAVVRADAPGSATTSTSVLSRRGDKLLAGVVDRRSAGVGNEGDVFSRQSAE